jgi:hypothetical protein
MANQEEYWMKHVWTFVWQLSERNVPNFSYMIVLGFVILKAKSSVI